MAFTSITTPIAEAWVNAYNTKASGAVKAGQAVVPGYGNNYVTAPTASLEKSQTQYCCGVAAYDATNKKSVAVYPPGTIVQGRASGAITVGDAVYVYKYGFFHTASKEAHLSGQVCGVALEAATNGKAFSLLLK